MLEVVVLVTQFEVREARRQAVPTARDHEAPPTPFFKRTITYRGTARDTWAWRVNRQSIGSSSVRLVVVVVVVVVVGTWRRRHFVGRRRHFGALGGGGGAKAKVGGLPRQPLPPPPPFAL